MFDLLERNPVVFGCCHGDTHYRIVSGTKIDAKELSCDGSVNYEACFMTS